MFGIIETLNKQYQDHKVFGELQQIIEFYQLLSESIYTWLEPGSRLVFGLNANILTSIEGTLESIRAILLNGRINDAYALVRKYHDSVLISSYLILFADVNKKLGNLVIDKIDIWVKGEQKLPKISRMLAYLKKSDRFTKINALLFKDQTYEAIRSRCNDHMHYNLFYYMQANDNSRFSEKRITFLTELSEDVRNIFIMHCAYMFTINDYYLLASDYIDAQEMGMTPPEGSEKFVAPFIQEAFNVIIKPHRKDTADEIKASTDFDLT